MKSFKYENTVVYYKNIGQQAQASLRVMFGQDPKADNKPAGADIIINGLHYQIKSARATVCHTHSLEHVRTEYYKAEAFIYAEPVTCTAYIMTFDEFIEFATEFAEETYESTKNNKGAKMRLGRKFKAQREWLQARV